MPLPELEVLVEEVEVDVDALLLDFDLSSPPRLAEAKLLANKAAKSTPPLLPPFLLPA